MNVTSNPKLFTTSFIFELSVETCITSNKLDDLAVFRICEIIGLPQKSLIFLRAIRFDPSRAGIIAKRLFI
jgi:hypothetical protein